MNSREEYLKYIVREISVWEHEIERRGDIKLYDGHILAQYHVMRLLNIVFGYQLNNLDNEIRNQTAIDLGDDINSIAFQVTAEIRREKIDDTIKKFNDEQLYNQYHELYFFMLKRKRNYRDGFDTQGHFKFDSQKHILDFGDLIREINKLEISKLKEISQYFDQEIKASTDIGQNDLIIYLEYYPETELGTAYNVKLINSGQRPITIVDVILNLASGRKITYTELRSRYIQLSTPLPQKLSETDYAEYLFPLYFLNELRKEITSPLDIVFITVVNSLNKIYSFPTTTSQSQNSFSELRRTIQDDWKKNDWLSDKKIS